MTNNDVLSVPSLIGDFNVHINDNINPEVEAKGKAIEKVLYEAFSLLRDACPNLDDLMNEDLS